MESKTLSALVLLLLTLGTIVTNGNLLQLGEMIKKVTGKSATVDYHAYGCYCGWGGKGKPLDGTDGCCHRHDCCYDRVISQGCSPKKTSYSYTYRSQNVQCGGGTQCQKKICACDRDFVMCLKRHLGSFKKSYRYYGNWKCRGSAPKC